MKPGDIIRYKKKSEFLQGLGKFKIRSISNDRIYFTNRKGKVLSSPIEFTHQMFEIVEESEMLFYDAKEGF